MRAGMRAGKQASLRSLRLREADRAPANAGARLRSGGMCGAAASRRPGSSYRSELVRRGCADRNPSRPPRWIAASLRHCAPRYGVSASPWRCAPLRRRSGIAPVPRTPPRRRFGLALEPPPLRRRPDLALELCLRDGVSASVWCRVPRDSVSTLLWGPRPLP